MSAGDTRARLRKQQSRVIVSYRTQVKCERIDDMRITAALIESDGPADEYVTEVGIEVWAITETTCIVRAFDVPNVDSGWWLWTGCNADDVVEHCRAMYA